MSKDTHQHYLKLALPTAHEIVDRLGVLLADANALINQLSAAVEQRE